MLTKLKTKSLWVGLIGAGALLANTFLGVEIGTDVVNSLAEGIASAMVLYGIFTDHGK